MDVKDRTQGIGGSDAHHLFNRKPYGCRRLLWYEKRGVEADYPFFGNNATKRGNKLEALVCEEYYEKTGIKPERVSEPYKFEGWAVGHIDRKIKRKGVEGVLEAKVPGREVFSKIKSEGLPDYYIFQMQHYLLITGYEFGEFAIFWADGWELITFTVNKNKLLTNSIHTAGKKFWTEYVKGDKEPPRLPCSDKRCVDCAYRYKCQGKHILETVKDDIEHYDEGYAVILEELRHIDSICKKADKRKEEIKNQIKEAMGEKTLIETIGGRITYKPTISNRWDTKSLEHDHPELAEQYKKPSVSRTLRHSKAKESK